MWPSQPFHKLCPPPGFPQKEFFFVRDIHRKSAWRSKYPTDYSKPRLWIADELSHRCHGGPRPALELHPLELGNWYMSRRRRIIPVCVHAPMLADFWFALVPARITHGAPPTEMNFHLLALYRRQLLHPAVSLTCQHGINPSPNTLPLNSTSGLRVHRRVAAKLVNNWRHHGEAVCAGIVNWET
jgi:hypothetical protein